MNFYNLKTPLLLPFSAEKMCSLKSWVLMYLLMYFSFSWKHLQRWPELLLFSSQIGVLSHVCFQPHQCFSLMYILYLEYFHMKRELLRNTAGLEILESVDSKWVNHRCLFPHLNSRTHQLPDGYNSTGEKGQPPLLVLPHQPLFN